MEDTVAYILGILTVLVPIIVMYSLSLNFSAIDNAWDKTFCSQI